MLGSKPAPLERVTQLAAKAGFVQDGRAEGVGPRSNNVMDGSLSRSRCPEISSELLAGIVLVCLRITPLYAIVLGDGPVDLCISLIGVKGLGYGV